MNTKLLLIAIAAVSFTSCSSVYKSGQTPDDVYFSPVRTYDVAEKVEEDRNDTRRDNGRYYAEQSQIRFGINNPRWRYLDDYAYNPYMYGYNYGYYYNPYYCSFPVYNYNPIVTINPKVNTPRMTNLAAYNSTAYNNSNLTSKYNNPVNMPVRSYGNNNSRLSNTLNKVFNSGSNYNNSNNRTNNNSSNNSTQSSRSYTPSSSSSSSSSGSSSSGGSTARPARNGKG